MKYYAGLDVAMKETFICILSEEGERIFESKAPTDPQPIYDELVKSGVELEKVGLESGSLSNYLTKGLQDLGVKAMCIDARKMAAILSVTINKTDKTAARGIADAMRCNHYKLVNLRDNDNGSTGVLLKSRATLVDSRRTLKNTIRGFLKAYGIRLGAVSNQQFPKTVRDASVEVLSHAKLGMESLLKSYEAMHSEIKKIEKSLNEICKYDEDDCSFNIQSRYGRPESFSKVRICGSLLWNDASTIFFGRISEARKYIQMWFERCSLSSNRIWDCIVNAL